MRKNILFTILTIILTFLIIVAIRFLTLKDHHVHFHANFAVFIDGKRFDFTDKKYMEEVSACFVEGILQPRQRVHLHEQNQDVVHVHDNGVAWSHLFTNLGWSFGFDYIIDDSGNFYKTTEGKSLKFILNGKDVSSPFNDLIKSEDRLVVSYGAESVQEVIERQYSQVASSAGEFNHNQDPASCSGGHADLTFSEKLQKALNILD
jgi:hypothetical protein